jgi:anti-sigma factor ChrR (cupin superfamily)
MRPTHAHYVSPGPNGAGCEQADVACAAALQALPAAELPAARAHVAGCAACRDETASLGSVLEHFVAWPTDVLRPSRDLRPQLAERVAEVTGREALPAPPRPWREPDWRAFAPGIECKLLSTDRQRKRVSMLLCLAPGARYPAHSRAGFHELHLLEGELWMQGRKLMPGSYDRCAPGSVNGRIWSEIGCTCVLVTSLEDLLQQT